jgi:hypothetical protein
MELAILLVWLLLMVSLLLGSGGSRSPSSPTVIVNANPSAGPAPSIRWEIMLIVTLIILWQLGTAA